MRFKEFLVEGLTDKEIRLKLKEWRDHLKTNWSKKWNLGKVKIEDGKVVHTSEEFKIVEFMVENGKLALPFASAYKIEVWAKSLTSFENFPEKLFFDYSHNKHNESLSFTVKADGLISLEHCPRYIFGSVDTSLVDNLNLSRCNKHIDHISQTWNISSRYVGPILSVLLINGIKNPQIWNSPKFQHLNRILLKYLPEKDILSAKEEMIAAGFKEWAKL